MGQIIIFVLRIFWTIFSIRFQIDCGASPRLFMSLFVDQTSYMFDRRNLYSHKKRHSIFEMGKPEPWCAGRCIASYYTASRGCILVARFARRFFASKPSLLLRSSYYSRRLSIGKSFEGCTGFLTGGGKHLYIFRSESHSPRIKLRWSRVK